VLPRSVSIRDLALDVIGEIPWRPATGLGTELRQCIFHALPGKRSICCGI
jgi:hypothetical protein